MNTQATPERMSRKDCRAEWKQNFEFFYANFSESWDSENS